MRPAVPAVGDTKLDTTTTSSEVKQEDVAPKKREPPIQTPIVFPSIIPPPPTLPPPDDQLPLRTFLRGIQRPTDISVDHVAAFGLHMIENASLEDLMPDTSYLPKPEWCEPPPADYEAPAPGKGTLLNNGRNAPGHKAFYDRVKELSTDNATAFRMVRRLPPAPGEEGPRLGNSYEFFKNLEVFSGFWKDTTLEGPEPFIGDGDEQPLHQRVHVRTGTGSQTPAEFRQNLLASVVKLATFDFTCNVSLPRVEPRLYIGPSKSKDGKFPHTSPATSFPANIHFIYRTPNDRLSARGGIIEGPIAALSARHTTGFETTFEQHLDLCREIVCILVTAQYRAREGTTEVPHDKEDAKKWWCHKHRWGGGSGGPIGKEENRSGPSEGDESVSAGIEKSLADAKAQKDEEMASSGRGMNGRRGDLDAIRTALASGGPLPQLGTQLIPAAPKKNNKGKTMPLYDNYRTVRPPVSTWDKKCRYMAIGKIAAAEYDDIFLVNCLNHHVCVSRARVPKSLIDTIEGRQEKISEPFKVWRTKWYDLFVKEERIEAFTAIWGMMNWLMRTPKPDENPDPNPYGDCSVYSAEAAAKRKEAAEKAAAEKKEAEVAKAKQEQEPEPEKMEGVEQTSS